jgi:DNA-binding ferritin-like protein (Dps family)
MRCFKSDPCASDYQKNYKETEQYLWELIERDGSVLGGLISAMERHLEK